MKKRILVLLEDMVEDSEFLYPYLRLKEEGFDVLSAAPGNKIYRGKGGMSFKPDWDFSDIKMEEFDAVVIPGGYAPDRWRRDREILDFVKRHHDNGKLIASICHGPWVLISAGLVKGKRITAFHAIKDDLINAGADYTGNDMEEDGLILTSTNPNTMLPMMKRLVERLQE